MTPARWQLVKTELAAVLDAPDAERGAYLRALGARDPALFGEVESLLRADAANGSRLSAPLVEDTDDADGSDALRRIGRSFGAYRLLAVIGEGGMGTVYRAERNDGAFERQVAVKVIRGGVSREHFVSRFQTERQILARLDHPSIARLIDGGASADGVPYLVMELVEGLPIDEYCQSAGLTLAQRLALFRQVCAAVQYAHQSLVVHRDLKPGNILVTASGMAKLLDFGIARVTTTAADGTTPDQTAMPIMTLNYASPEQVRGERITTAADVYSLGVILYVLLTGSRPYPPGNGSTLDAMRAICELEPPAPSTTAQAKDARDTAALRRQLAGDLDSIVLKALRKRPEERYGTVEQFAADIGRYVDGLPVLARRDTTGYALRKFVRRHALAVSVAALAILVIAVGLAVVSVLLLRVRAAAAETSAALASSQAVSDFLEQDVLAAANPELTERAEMPVREVLDGASRRVDLRFASRPLQAAAVHRALGQAWNGVGDVERATAQTQAAIDVLRHESQPAAAAERLAAVNALVVYALRREDYAAARAALDANPPDRAAPRSTAELGERLYWRALDGTVVAHQGRFKEGLAEIRAVRDEALRTLGPYHAQSLAIRESLAASLLDAGIYPEAEREFQALIRDRELMAGEGGSGAIDARENLGELLVLQGREAEALPMIEQLYAEEQRLFGADDARVIDTGQTLAAAYDNVGRTAEAETLYVRLIAMSERRLGAESSRTLSAKRNLATLYMGLNQWARALALEESILPVYERTGRGTTRFAIQVRRDIGSCLNKLGRWSAALVVNQRTVDDTKQYLADQDVLQYVARGDLATSLGHLGQAERAAQLYDEGIAGLTEVLGKDHQLTRRYLAERAEFKARVSH